MMFLLGQTLYILYITFCGLHIYQSKDTHRPLPSVPLSAPGIRHTLKSPQSSIYALSVGFYQFFLPLVQQHGMTSLHLRDPAT